MTSKELVMGRIDRIKGSLKSTGKPLVRKVRGVDHGRSTTVESRTEGSGRDNKTRQTRATTRGRNKQAERPVRSNQATTRRPCPYYLWSRVKESDGIPEEQRNIENKRHPSQQNKEKKLQYGSVGWRSGI
ncbi:hypothetical protein TNCV_4978301 [Trichonephila clavipes]|nr:hypothetical protein TNCV_4978301 [Trichonephila clavipes]